MAIRYDKNFNREIARVVKNFNSKIMRLEGMARVLAPDTVLVSELKSQYSERRKLKSRLKELQLFSQKGMEEELIIGQWNTTRYDYLLDKRRAAVAKRNITRELNKVVEKPRINQTLYVKNLKKRQEILNRPIQELSKKMIETRQRIINRESNLSQKRQILYNNMFQMIYKTAYTAGISPEIIEKVLHEMRKLSPAELSDAMDTMPAMSAFIIKYKLMDRIGQSGPAQTAEALDNMLEALSGVQQFYSI